MPVSRDFTGLNYNAPNGELSTIDANGMTGEQLETFKYLKKSIVDSRRHQYFMPLASVENMPKHMGKTIKAYQYVPLLDDRNINDQGIDANGAVIYDKYRVVLPVDGSNEITFGSAGEATAAESAINALDSGNASTAAEVLTATNATFEVAGAGTGSNDVYMDLQDLVDAVPGATYDVLSGSGNLHGSSRDVGTITSKIPALTENGGRVNRVGFTRIVREGSLHKFGFFTEFTKESMDFDSDESLMDHISTELMTGAVELSEAVLQRDLLAAADTVLYAGTATSDDEVTGEDDQPNGGDLPSVLSYSNFSRLDQILTDNRTPRQTKVITGSRMVDTRVIPAGRVAYVGSELVPMLKQMKDSFGNKALIEVQHYADAGNTMNGEIGAMDSFRIIQVPEMLHWAGEGAKVDSSDEGYRTTYVNGDEHFDVFPVLVVGDDSFSTIGFQSDGKSVKFNVITKMPGRETAGYLDPFGETGFSSIKWYYGILVKRPERLGMIKTVAPV